MDESLGAPQPETPSLVDFDNDTIDYMPHCNQTLQSVESTGTITPERQFSIRERPYSCHVCNKRFTQKAHLIIHKRTHTGEKPYSCHICHKRFAQSSHLTVHKRVHTGEKPFFCNFCGMGFCRRPRLEAHVLQHVVREGRQLPNSLKGDMMGSLSMVGLGSASADLARVSQESLEVAAQLMSLKTKANTVMEIKNEPMDDNIRDSINDERNDKTGEDRTAIPMDNVMTQEGISTDRTDAARLSESSDESENIKSSEKKYNGSSTNGIMGLLAEDLEKLTSGLTELTDYQKSALSQSLILASQKGQLSGLTDHSHTTGMGSNHSSLMMNPGLTMSGLVRTNSRVSLVDFTADDIMRHLLSRDDVKSCDFCCIVFHDPAMYYLHRSMHDKMDVRCCNLCGKLLTDKYDFTAHFLSQHK